VSAKPERPQGTLEGNPDGWCEYIAAVEAHAEQAEQTLAQLVPDVLVLIQDYYSGLPEDRAPVDGAVARLSQLLEDEDGKPRPEFAVKRRPGVAQVRPGATSGD
jgi:hypothetical protein